MAPPTCWGSLAIQKVTPPFFHPAAWQHRRSLLPFPISPCGIPPFVSQPPTPPPTPKPGLASILKAAGLENSANGDDEALKLRVQQQLAALMDEGAGAGLNVDVDEF